MLVNRSSVAKGVFVHFLKSLILSLCLFARGFALNLSYKVGSLSLLLSFGFKFHDMLFMFQLLN